MLRVIGIGIAFIVTFWSFYSPQYLQFDIEGALFNTVMIILALLYAGYFTKELLNLEGVELWHSMFSKTLNHGALALLYFFLWSLLVGVGAYYFGEEPVELGVILLLSLLANVVSLLLYIPQMVIGLIGKLVLARYASNKKFKMTPSGAF